MEKLISTLLIFPALFLSACSDNAQHTQVTTAEIIRS